jgi:hypothetical protein
MSKEEILSNEYKDFILLMNKNNNIYYNINSIAFIKKISTEESDDKKFDSFLEFLNYKDNKEEILMEMEKKFYFQTGQFFMNLQNSLDKEEYKIIETSKLYRSSLDEFLRSLDSLDDETYDYKKFNLFLSIKLLHLSEFMYFSTKRIKTAELMVWVQKYHSILEDDNELEIEEDFDKKIEEDLEEKTEDEIEEDEETLWHKIFTHILQGKIIKGLKKLKKYLKLKTFNEKNKKILDKIIELIKFLPILGVKSDITDYYNRHVTFKKMSEQLLKEYKKIELKENRIIKLLEIFSGNSKTLIEISIKYKFSFMQLLLGKLLFIHVLKENLEDYISESYNEIYDSVEDENTTFEEKNEASKDEEIIFSILNFPKVNRCFEVLYNLDYWLCAHLSDLFFHSNFDIKFNTNSKYLITEDLSIRENSILQYSNFLFYNFNNFWNISLNYTIFTNNSIFYVDEFISKIEINDELKLQKILLLLNQYKNINENKYTIDLIIKNVYKRLGFIFFY